MKNNAAIAEAAEFKNIDSLACVSSPMASEKIEFKWWRLSAMKLGLRGLEAGAGVRPGNPLLKKIRAIDVVPELSPMPVLFVHGTQDPTVDARHSRALFEKAGEPKEIRIFDNASHAEEIYRQFPKEFIRTVTDWFEKTL